MNNIIEKYIVAFIALAVTAGLVFNAFFATLVPLVSYLLGIIMFGIGINLNGANFKPVWDIKGKTIIIVALKFIFVSIGAFILSKVFNLNAMETAGLVILGSCPGGTVANIYSFLTRSNLALTVTLTILSTLIAPIVIPALLYLYLHKTIHIPYFGMFIKTLEIVILPIVAGILLNKYISGLNQVKKALPSISIICVCLIVAIVVAINQSKVIEFPVTIILICLVLNIYSFLVAFIMSKLIKLDTPSTRSAMFEFGMLDSGLATVLSLLFFNPTAALVGTIYSVTQNIVGPTFVKVINLIDTKTQN